MVRAALFLPVLLGACGGPNDVSRLTRIQVLAAVAEPPEVAPGGTTTVTIWVWSPPEQAVELMAWTCTDFGAGCLEAAIPVDERVFVPVVVDGAAVLTVTVPTALAPLVAESPVPASLWVLACEEGKCPLIADAREGRADAADLADPPGLLEDLPLEGVSLVRRDVLVSTAAVPNANPVLTETPDAEVLLAGKDREVALGFAVQDDDEVSAVGWTTRGAVSTPTVDGTALDATWFTEETAGAADLWLVVEDGRGGSAVWRGAGEVTE